MGPQVYQPGKKALAAAVLAVAATYGYFLIFAQFGFLKTVLAAVTGEAAVKPIMASMGGAGIAGSVLAAVFFRAERSRQCLATGFIVCALAAGLSCLVESAGGLHGVAVLVGSGTGFTTVTLASMLRRAVGRTRLGLSIGLGTGLAYGFCNVPAVFEAGASTQAGIALLMAGAGVVGAGLITLDPQPVVPGGFDHTAAGRAGWTLVFLALVGLDSAAFYIIQHTPALKEGTWSGDKQLVANAGAHLIGAVLAGYALDRGWVGRTVGAGALALLVACWLIGGSSPPWGGALLYAAGVSAYSTALVYYPARSLRPGLAALVYGVAGWGGSALGIGLAEGRPVLPEEFILAAGGVIFGALFIRQCFRRRETDPGDFHEDTACH